ncbi:hypothetical protein [Nocardioides sp. CFH 31398]|uniref:hypothetical protein n=1 Tax=Nocardioides sp. CFH 31398 TaxID=2919579 RepID=UPI001F050FDC|nr:hypothetical protein [Nocardioides sp. CFH 31398]MCH1866102.1 hypothetical protein [Nocardioides sp. CFH 31398]
MRALRTTTRVTATLTAAGVMALAAGPAMAADTTVVAQSEAEAIYLAIGGQAVTDQLGGQYRVERTESGETSEGNNQPQANLITGQDNLAAGTLAQDAKTGLAGNQGVSQACSGIAGPGSSFVGVGENGRCLTPGRRAEINLTPDGLTLDDLFNVEPVEDSGSLSDILDGLGQAEINAALNQLNQGLQQALAPLGDAGLVAGFNAIRSECTAGPGEVATGDATLADVDVTLNFPPSANQDPIELLSLESDPAPNTPLVTGLDEVVGEILDSLLANLDRKELGGLGGQLKPIRDAIKEQILAQIADNAGPIEENLIDGTLNKQTRAPGEIEVTAVDLAILPVLQGQAGFNAVDLRLARSQCGPGATLAPPVVDDPTDPSSPDVPRFVPAGVSGGLVGTAGVGMDSTVPAALALLALTTFGTAIGFTTSRSRAEA